MPYPDEVDQLRRDLQLQTIAHERLAQRMDRIHRLLAEWESEDLDDYKTLVAIKCIVRGHVESLTLPPKVV